MQDILRNMPQVDEILKHGEIPSYREFLSGARIKEIVRFQTDKIRKQIISREVSLTDRTLILEKIVRHSVRKMDEEIKDQSQKVINGTGIIIHTNLGRSPLSKKASERALRLSSCYSNLEYGTREGKRRSRLKNIEKMLTDLTGAEAALVVNNNAAAVFLALNSMCLNRKVIVSRGELVEIGDSFRISEIVETSGCIVKEVGTTNKTYLRDIERAICENTGILLKMHTSNYKIVGFTENVEAKEMVRLGEAHGIPVMEDMGSGVLFDLRELGLKYERTVQDAVNDSVDIITFSGDKMLGGPQCGIIVGRKKYIDKMKQNQLLRCLRVDKMCLFALEATVSQYFNKRDILEIPIYKKMAEPLDMVKDRAIRLKLVLENPKLKIEIRPHNAQFGGGSLPFEYIESYAIFVTSDIITASTIDSFLRSSPVPVVGTIHEGEYILDLRTLDDDDFDYLGRVFSEMVE